MAHVRTSVPCREALADKAQDVDGLQELCRSAASTACRPEEPGTQAPAGNSDETSQTISGSPVEASANIQPDYSAMDATASPGALKKLRQAAKRGYLSQTEHNDLQKILALPEHSNAMQDAAVSKFLSLEPGDLRWVVDKGAWLTQCLRYCARTSSVEPQCDGNSPKSVLLAALASHALLPDVLTQECWDTFSDLNQDEQSSCISAVRASIPSNVQGKYSEHFVSLCCNETVIYSLEALPPPRMHLRPSPVEWEAIEGTLYHRLLQQFLFRQANCEERLFKELAEADPDMQPGDPGSLLHTHKATEEGRRSASAEVLALLHAGAASGLTRACARFIAEGLDVNERTGIQQASPLHIAAAHGEVGVLRLLLMHRADPRILNGEGHGALYVAVETAVRLSKTDRDPNSSASTTHTMQVRACNELLQAGAESVMESGTSAENLAEQNDLHDLVALIRLHRQLRNLKSRGIADEATVSALQNLQYETANFTIGLFEKFMLPKARSDLAAAEFRALISSDFISQRDKIQHHGNRLGKRLHLGRRAVETLVNLPYEVATHVLNTWKLEETVPGIFEVPDHLNNSGSQQTQQISSPQDGVDGERIHQEDGDANAAQTQNDGIAAIASAQGPPKLQGRVRKWDPERGFGFIVQDAKNGEEGNKDIFVHRSNVVGSSPTNHIDLKENCRVSYRLGEQDGRLRALEATMIDSSSTPLPIHSGIRTADPDATKDRKGGDVSDNEGLDEDDDITCKFMRYIRSREIQELEKEKRADGESWLRCIGLCKNKSGRRDEAIWRKEIDNRIDVFLSKGTTPLHKKDFDFRVRRFLQEYCVSSSVMKVSDLLSLVEASTAGKNRNDVRSWPAYLATLLRRENPKLYENLADRDRRSRIELRKKQVSGGNEDLGDTSALTDDAIADLDAADLIDEDGEGAVVIEDDDLSSPRDYSPRSSEIASTPRSSEESSAEEMEPSSAAPRVPPGPPPLPVPDPSAGPGANLFRYGSDTTAQAKPSRTFQ